MGKAFPSISGQQTKLEERNHNQLPSAIKNQTCTKGQRKKDKRGWGGKAGGDGAGDDELQVSWKLGATPQPGTRWGFVVCLRRGYNSRVDFTQQRRVKRAAVGISIQLHWLTRLARVCSGPRLGGWWGETRSAERLNGRGGGRVPGDGATSDLWGLKRRIEKGEGEEEKDGGGGKAGSQVLTNAQPDMQPGFWGRERCPPPKGSERPEERVKGWGLTDNEGTAGAWRTQPTDFRDKDAHGHDGSRDTSWLGWNRIKSVHEDCHPQLM